MYKRLIGCLILANIILSILVPSTISTDGNQWWDENWSFRQEISIPINTTVTNAHYQPIDIFIEFDNSCWAKNEKEHSLRIIFKDESIMKELESQIYDLVHTDNDYIGACSLVFLVPGEANGNEKYYVYYDDEQKPTPAYPNRVGVGESYYQYEPIQGLQVESSFYEIIEGDYFVYAVNKEGEFLTTSTSQQVVKLKKNSKEVLPKNGEELASFVFTYWWQNNGKWSVISTAEKLVSNKIFVDGNLMVKFGIVSESNNGIFRSTVIYKYYYCPTEDKKIHVRTKHEVIKYPLPSADEIDVSYVLLTSGGVKNSYIGELNFGRIPPYLHFYSEEERVLSYDIEPYPEGSYLLIGKEEDCDLGSTPWLSIDDGVTGKAHGVIFESNSVIKSGEDERDGIELQLYEENQFQFLGLDVRLAHLYINRNGYEKGEQHDSILPEDYVIEFDAEFFTTENGGYLAVEKEASIYQKLVRYQPKHIENITDDNKSEGNYELTIYPQLPQSLLLEMGLATLMLKNPCIIVELYRNNSLFTSKRASRFSLDPETVIDWENISLFKRVSFDDLPAGPYLIKIWFKNPPFEDERQFIGWQLIDLQEDEETRIKCVPAGWIQVSVSNQYEAGVENAQVYIIKDDVIIAEGESNISGNIPISVPYDLKDTYTLKVAYKGFLVCEQQIRVGLIRKILPLKILVEIAVHDVTINVQDDQGNAPSFNVGMKLTSDDMEYPTEIMPDKSSPGTYIFSDLYPADYTLGISYQSFEVEENIQIPKISSMAIVLHDFVVNVKDTWGLPPGINLDIVMVSNDFVKPVVTVGKSLSVGLYQFSNLYLGNYTLEISCTSFVVKESIKISPYASNELAISFPAEFNVSAIVLDARGNPLKDAKVVMIRSGKEVNRTTDESGNVIFSIPPGSYNFSIYYNNKLIANSKVEVLNIKTHEIVTNNEPLLPSIITSLTIILLAVVAFLSYRKKDAMFFLKILAISLVIIAIVSPWWELHGSSSNPYIETSTNLFITPAKMVTITSNDNVTIGEPYLLGGGFSAEVNLFFTTLVVDFVSVMELLPTVMIVGIICIISSLILTNFSKRRLSFVVFLLAIILFIVTIGVFSYSMSELASASIGGFIGEGNLGVSVPGEKSYDAVLCSWGPNIGFYLLLFSIGILIFTIASDIRKRFEINKKCDSL